MIPSPGAAGSDVCRLARTLNGRAALRGAVSLAYLKQASSPRSGQRIKKCRKFSEACPTAAAATLLMENE